MQSLVPRLAPLVLLSALGLAACGPSDPAPKNVEPAPIVSQANEAAPPPRYVGAWATTSDQCADPAWIFVADGVSTAGEVSCEFQSVTETETGYAAEASCIAQSPPQSYRIALEFDGLVQTMRVSGGPWSAPIDLVSCAPTGT